MKRKPLLSIVPAVLLLCSAAAAESRLFLGAGANYIRPADENYRSAYGGQAIYPEFWGAVRLVAGLCLSGSYGRFAKDGLTPVLELEARATQSYFTAGLTYLQRVSSLLCLQAGGGVASLSFREEALGTAIDGRKLGLSAEGGILVAPEDERIFMSVKAGYVSARVADLDPAISGRQSARLGGFRIAVSVGIQLFSGE